MNYLKDLNPEQYKAVTASLSPVCVIASAGSGKTKTLTARIQHYIDLGEAPRGIWACTFTKKAAANMKERLIKNGVDPITVNKLKIGTLHSLSYWILRQFYKNYHPSKEINVVPDMGVWTFLDKLIKKHDLRTRDKKAIISYISINKLNELSPDIIYEYIKPLLHQGFTEKNSTEVAYWKAYKEYEIYLNSNNYIDFSDMLYKTWKILKNESYEPFNKKIRKQVKHLLVDEFQDTNRVSYSLYKLLSQDTNSVYIVGDRRQAIYSFQGSSHTFFDEFIKDFNPNIIELTTNYRSSKTIVETSNVFMKSLNLPNLSNADTPNDIGFPVRGFYSINETQEAQNITNLVDQLVESGDFGYSDIAILYRVNAQAIPITDHFISKKIPHIVYSKGGYFKRREIRQVVAYLKAMVMPTKLTHKDIRLIMNAPLRYIKGVTIDLIEALKGDSFIEKMSNVHSLNTNDFQKKQVYDFYMDIKRSHSRFMRNEFQNTQVAILSILRDFKLEDYFKTEQLDESTDADEDKTLNIDVLMTISERYTSIEEFIIHAESMQHKKQDESEDNKVKLLTMHSSKGMEFPVVIIAGFCSRFHPLYRASSSDDYEEEKRVAYVGITRAEKRMYISTIYQNYSRFKVSPSTYISDMGISKDNFATGLF